MKNYIIIALAVLIVVGCLVSCGEKPKQEIDYSKQTETYVVDANGDLSVILDANPSTNFSWSYIISDPTAVTCTVDEMLPTTDSKVPAAGAPTLQHYVFSSVKKEFRDDVVITFLLCEGGESTLETMAEGYNAQLILDKNGLVLVGKWVEIEKPVIVDDHTEIVDGQLVVSLDTNPSTGYSWKCVYIDPLTNEESDTPKYLKLVSEDVVSEPTEEPVEGAPAVYTATYEGIAADNDSIRIETLKFSHISPDGETVGDEYEVSVVVEKDGTIVTQ